ncbi:polyprenyl synthetase family protein [Streptomyces sp. HUAS TT20]|uniref:polyprenyl synthetase family protein n=1 Tax=Streptomyces sp. HUAS TT20 TaxID=3447509 RepID=UPI0021D8F703|nr:polyprenyl synthetase family protein [Streptomyces sp. HUAS 15-9]UXY31272.1 polyprenyl synthetase family protein [Streptomyces sp. HUAS 15-9]
MAGSALADFLDQKCHTAESSRSLEPKETLRGFLSSGGKLIRPVMCLCGWYAAGGAWDPGPVVKAAASLELFHAFALIHDDVMDDSDARRGRPALHRLLAEFHRHRHTPGHAERHGVHAAVLLGDLALAWSDEMFHTAGLSPAQIRAARPLLDTMRGEVMFGQCLDLLATGRPIGDIEHALTISRFKTAKYTVERPLHIGAALAGAGQAMLDTLTAYALPLGEAFQLRDDLLGVFGDPRETGKPVDDDLREGKHTVLMAFGIARADHSQLSVLRSLVGRSDLDAEQADAIRDVLVSTGARAAVEQMISSRRRRALSALHGAPLPPHAITALRRLAHAASARSS